MAASGVGTVQGRPPRQAERFVNNPLSHVLAGPRVVGDESGQRRRRFACIALGVDPIGLRVDVLAVKARIGQQACAGDGSIEVSGLAGGPRGGIGRLARLRQTNRIVQRNDDGFAGVRRSNVVLRLTAGHNGRKQHEKGTDRRQTAVKQPTRATARSEADRHTQQDTSRGWNPAPEYATRKPADSM